MSITNKYDWPNILCAVWARFEGVCAAKFWTAFTRLQLRANGVTSVGEGLCAVGHSLICCRRRDSISLGEGVCIISRAKSNLVGLTGPVIFDTLGGGEIRIGDHSGLSGAVLSSRVRIDIGRYVKIGGNVRIYDHDFHSVDARARRDGASDQRGAKARPVLIGDDVFIGTNAIILKGSSIGARSIVGAGAVVAGLKVPPGSLVLGNPARVVKQLE